MNNFLSEDIRRKICIYIFLMLSSVFSFTLSAEKADALSLNNPENISALKHSHIKAADNSGPAADTDINKIYLNCYEYTYNNESPGSDKIKKDKVLRSSRILGLFAGALAGTATVFWSITGDLDNDTPLYVDTLSAFPSILIGSYTGIKAAQWAVSRMIENSEDSYFAFFIKGVFLSSLSGAVILTSSLFPLFAAGHYTDSINFNVGGDSSLLRIAGLSISGGTAYGAVFGALIGSVYSSVIYFILN